MLTDRGRWILAFGGAVYLAAWAFGATALYPIGLGLVHGERPYGSFARRIKMPDGADVDLEPDGDVVPGEMLSPA